MDLINQNKFKNVLIIILLAVNLLTVSIIWMQTSSKVDTQPSGKDKSQAAGESVRLMKQVLDLNEDQVKQLAKLRSMRIDEARKYNDSLDLLKRQLAEDLFKQKPDQDAARIKSAQIGELEAKVELSRFRHFSEMLALCTPEQKEKLKPVLSELFGRKSPKNDTPTRKPNANKKEFRPHADDTLSNQGLIGYETVNRDERPQQPLSIDGKLDKYSKRLNLTSEQKEKIRAVLLDEKQKNQQFRKRMNPDHPAEFENQKEKNRREEDENIMKLLDEKQKLEFLKMQEHKKQNTENIKQSTEESRRNGEGQKPGM